MEKSRQPSFQVPTPVKPQIYRKSSTHRLKVVSQFQKSASVTPRLNFSRREANRFLLQMLRRKPKLRKKLLIYGAAVARQKYKKPLSPKRRIQVAPLLGHQFFRRRTRDASWRPKHARRWATRCRIRYFVKQLARRTAVFLKRLRPLLRGVRRLRRNRLSRRRWKLLRRRRYRAKFRRLRRSRGLVRKLLFARHRPAQIQPFASLLLRRRTLRGVRFVLLHRGARHLRRTSRRFARRVLRRRPHPKRGGVRRRKKVRRFHYQHRICRKQRCPRFRRKYRPAPRRRFSRRRRLRLRRIWLLRQRLRRGTAGMQRRLRFFKKRCQRRWARLVVRRKRSSGVLSYVRVLRKKYTPKPKLYNNKRVPFSYRTYVRSKRRWLARKRIRRKRILIRSMDRIYSPKQRRRYRLRAKTAKKERKKLRTWRRRWYQRRQRTVPFLSAAIRTRKKILQRARRRAYLSRRRRRKFMWVVRRRRPNPKRGGVRRRKKVRPAWRRDKRRLRRFRKYIKNVKRWWSRRRKYWQLRRLGYWRRWEARELNQLPLRVGSKTSALVKEHDIPLFITRARNYLRRPLNKLYRRRQYRTLLRHIHQKYDSKLGYRKRHRRRRAYRALFHCLVRRRVRATSPVLYSFKRKPQQPWRGKDRISRASRPVFQARRWSRAYCFALNLRLSQISIRRRYSGKRYNRVLRAHRPRLRLLSLPFFRAGSRLSILKLVDRRPASLRPVHTHLRAVLRIHRVTSPELVDVALSRRLPRAVNTRSKKARLIGNFRRTQLARRRLYRFRAVRAKRSLAFFHSSTLEQCYWQLNARRARVLRNLANLRIRYRPTSRATLKRSKAGSKGRAKKPVALRNTRKVRSRKQKRISRRTRLCTKYTRAVAEIIASALENLS